jgi:hypothetical protein
MSPQLLWTIAGLILTVLSIGNIGISSAKSIDAANGKLIALEVGNISIAVKLWLVDESADKTFTAMYSDLVQKKIPDLTVVGSGSTSFFKSNAYSGVTYFVSMGASQTSYQVAISGMTPEIQPHVSQILSGVNRCMFFSVTNIDGAFMCDL